MGTQNFRRTHSSSFLGAKGDDSIPFSIPAGEQFLSASVGWAVQNFNEHKEARITSQPVVGATGSQTIGIHWWFDGPSSVHGVGSFMYTLSVMTGIPGKIIVFEHIDFGGQYRFFDLPCTSLSGAGLNDKVSSLAVLQGNWSFYRDADFNSPYMRNGSPIVLSPGVYRWIEDVGISNDDLTALQAVSDPPNP